jgi:hypothetical protein
MLDEEIELFPPFEVEANSAIDDLLEQIMTGDNPEEAKALLERLALQYPDDAPTALCALAYYRGMRSALSEEEFRWFGVDAPVNRKMLRRERLQQYKRYRELFEIEVEGTRRQKASVMALQKDWSQLGEHINGAVRLARSRWMLRAAGVLYRIGVPGALDVCDAAAFQLFRAAYIQT